MKVFDAIIKVAGDIAQAGIAKDKKNVQQGYAFRGIDDVYNCLAPLLAKHNLCILPRVISRELTERAAKGGGVLFSVVVHMEFDFVCALDGSKYTASAITEAMDSADKATNKAMSAAYKMVCFQAFCIPTEGDNDADATTHQVEAPRPARPAPARPAPARPAPAPAAAAPSAAPDADAGTISTKQAQLLHIRIKEAGCPWEKFQAMFNGVEKVSMLPADKMDAALAFLVDYAHRNTPAQVPDPVEYGEPGDVQEREPGSDDDDAGRPFA